MGKDYAERGDRAMYGRVWLVPIIASLVILIVHIAWKIPETVVDGNGVDPVRETVREGQYHELLELAAIGYALDIAAVGKRIDEYLSRRGSPMAGYGWVFIRESRRTGINPHLPVAISGIESYFGTRCFAPRNAWGMLAYPRGFPSWEAGICASFEWLRRYYGCPQSPYDCPGYCIPDHPWAENVSRIIMEMEAAAK